MEGITKLYRETDYLCIIRINTCWVNSMVGIYMYRFQRK